MSTAAPTCSLCATYFTCERNTPANRRSIHTSMRAVGSEPDRPAQHEALPHHTSLADRSKAMRQARRNPHYPHPPPRRAQGHPQIRLRPRLRSPPTEARHPAPRPGSPRHQNPRRHRPPRRPRPSRGPQVHPNLRRHPMTRFLTDDRSNTLNFP